MACGGHDGSKRHRRSVRLDVRLEEAPLETFVDALVLLAEHYFKQEVSPKGEPIPAPNNAMEAGEDLPPLQSKNYPQGGQGG